MKNGLSAVLFLSAILAWSCGDANPDKIKSKYRYPVQTLSADQIEKLFSERSGKCLALFVWSRWSVHATASFPTVVALDKEYKDRGANVEFVGISTDSEDFIQDHLIPFLTHNEAEFPNFLHGFDDEKKFIKAVDEKWRGGVPSIFIFNKDGNLAFSFSGKVNAPVVRYAIESLIYPDYVPAGAFNRNSVED